MKMHQCCYLFALLACLLASASASSSLPIGDSKLLQLMRATRSAQQTDPQRSLDCFHYYSELFEGYLQIYETEFAQCEADAKNLTEKYDSNYVGSLKNLNTYSDLACTNLLACYDSSRVLDSFGCFAQVGPESSKDIYAVSTNASVYYGQLLLQYQYAQFEEETCKNTSRNAYEQRCDAAYVDLQKCLKGEIPVPTPEPTTISTTVATTTRTTTTPTTVPTPPEDNFNSDIANILNKIKHLNV
ncbi:uncharacterized protein LOC115634193 [Scaptodrosophila lebanonensis]|uniref:Uncharacterized protein LOC115634193 n=1 Tax=Drosophila lebanonensis TaxID=7225 RepID=A0A6J2UGP2_DROLE|nr:uncharacterized protein LOC115634193 [Scaptodrosophila lebanonensis]